MNNRALVIIGKIMLLSCFIAVVSTSDSAFGQDTEPTKQELAKLQGTWNFVYYEDLGVVQRSGNCQFVISDQKLTFRQNGDDKIETTIEVDSTLMPKQLTQKFTDGQLYQSIYILADDLLILCGDRDKTKRPTEFSRGTDEGGEFLIVLKRQ